MVSLPINQHVQRMNLGGEVVLIEIDLTQYGEGIIRFCPYGEGEEGTAVNFGGKTYLPHAMEMEGFEVSGDGPHPTPSVLFANTKNIFTALIVKYNSLLGASFRRIRTFDRFLDNGAEPDGDAMVSDELYTLDEKPTHNRVKGVVGWKLSSAMDQRGAMLPNRVMIRDYCTLITRSTVSGAYDYTRATCPYTGAQAYDANGNTTTPDKEVFSKTLENCCYIRFDKKKEIPFGGFPGIARHRL